MQDGSLEVKILQILYTIFHRIGDLIHWKLYVLNTGGRSHFVTQPNVEHIAVQDDLKS